MAIRVTCECGVWYDMRDDLAGKKGKCVCGRVLRIPARNPATQPGPAVPADSEQGDHLHLSIESSARGSSSQAVAPAVEDQPGRRRFLLVSLAACVLIGVGIATVAHFNKTDTSAGGNGTGGDTRGGAKTPVAAVDARPTRLRVLEHVQRSVNQMGSGVEVYSKSSAQLDAAARREFLTVLAGAWDKLRIEDMSRPAGSQPVASVRGLTVYNSDGPDRITLLQIQIFDEPAVTMVKVMDDPELAGYRYVIDGVAVGGVIDRMSK